MSDTVKLPEPDTKDVDYLIARDDGSVRADQQQVLVDWAREYGLACYEAGVRAGMERAAKICFWHDKDRAAEGREHDALACAAAIRSESAADNRGERE